MEVGASRPCRPCTAAAVARRHHTLPCSSTLHPLHWIPPLDPLHWIPSTLRPHSLHARCAGGDYGIPFPSATGPVKATVYNVRRYGATGDGRTPDDAAVQRAVAAATDPAATGWRVVFFPAGSYLLSAPLYVNVSNVVIRGEGPSRTRLQFRASLSDVYGGTYGVDPCTSAWGRAAAGRGALVERPGRTVGCERVVEWDERTRFLPGGAAHTHSSALPPSLLRLSSEQTRSSRRGPLAAASSR